MKYKPHFFLEEHRFRIFNSSVGDAITIVKDLQRSYVSQTNQSFKSEADFYNDLASITAEY